MKYTKLGNSDLTVSRVCMGCMGFGDAAHGQHTWTVDEDTTREIVKHGLDLGINFFDTVPGPRAARLHQPRQGGRRHQVSPALQ